VARRDLSLWTTLYEAKEHGRDRSVVSALEQTPATV
jgi:hypothetical protein